MPSYETTCYHHNPQHLFSSLSWPIIWGQISHIGCALSNNHDALQKVIRDHYRLATKVQLTVMSVTCAKTQHKQRVDFPQGLCECSNTVPVLLTLPCCFCHKQCGPPCYAVENRISCCTADIHVEIGGQCRSPTKDHVLFCRICQETEKRHKETASKSHQNHWISMCNST